MIGTGWAMSDKNPIDLINLFLDFVQSDLEGANSKEKKRAQSAVGRLIGLSDAFMISIAWSPGKNPDSNVWSDILKLQGEWRRSLDIFAGLLDHEFFHLAFNVPSHFTAYDDDYFYYGIEMKDWPERINVKVYLTEPLDYFEFYSPGGKASLPHDELELSYAFISILNALSRFPRSSLKRCPNCDKIFFEPTKPKKIYCSQRCQNTYAARRYRMEKRRA